jgi:hypothetical protein
MSMGAYSLPRTARVGVAPSGADAGAGADADADADADAGAEAPGKGEHESEGADEGNFEDEDEDDVLISSDEEESGRRARTSQSASATVDANADSDADANTTSTSTSTSTTSNHPNFLKISVKSSDMKRRLLAATKTHSNSSVNSGVNSTSLNSTSLNSSNHSANHSATTKPFLLTSQRKKQEQRDKRRSSILKSLDILGGEPVDEEDQVDYLALSLHKASLRVGHSHSQGDAAAERKGKGKVKGKGKLRPRNTTKSTTMTTRTDTTPDTSYSTTDLPATSTASASASATANTSRRRVSCPPSASTATAAAAISNDPTSAPIAPKGRYLRRGSVTKYQPQANVDGMQPTPTPTPTPAANSWANSTSVSPQQQYSNGQTPPSPQPLPTPQEEIDYYGYASDSYGYGSDTNHEAQSHRQHHSSSASTTSAPPLTSLNQTTQTTQRTGRYLRRGSVTRYKLQPEVNSMQASSHSMADDSDYASDTNTGELDYGYNTDDAASVASMPPLSSSALHESHQYHKPRRQRYQRRCSVTKFSLQTNTNSNGDTTIQATATAAVAAAKNDAYNSSDIDSEDDNDDDKTSSTHRGTLNLPVPKPTDDTYSENLEDSGRFLRRSIRVPDDSDSETDSDQDDDGMQSKRPPRQGLDSKCPPLSRDFSTSAVDNKKIIAQRKKEPATMNMNMNIKINIKPHARRKNELEDDSGHVRKRNLLNNSDHGGMPRRSLNTSTTTLEDDSGHIKKAWYKELLPNRRDSMSSVDSDENSEAEFGDDSVVSDSHSQLHRPSKPTYTKSPPKLPPQTAPPSLSSFLSSNQGGQPFSNAKTTIDGDTSICSSYLDDNASINDDLGRPSRRSKMRGRRTSIVGVPAGGDRVTSSAIDDASSYAGSHDEGEQEGETSTHSHGSRRRSMRARRTSIVGVPSGGDSVASSVMDDVALYAGSDDDTTSPSKRTKMRARRSSIVGIPGAEKPVVVASQSPPPPAKEAKREGMTKKTSYKKKDPTSTKKSKNSGEIKTKKSRSSAADSSPTKKKRTVRGCLKTSSLAQGTNPDQKQVRFGHLLIKEYPIILGE